MKTYSLIALFVFAVLLVACQSVTPAGQVETQVAATIAAGQSATAAVEQAVKMTLTASVPLPTETLPPSPTSVPTTAVPPTDTPVPTATKKPAVLPTVAPTLAPTQALTFPITLNLPASAGWFKTGAYLQASQSVGVTANGSVNIGNGVMGNVESPNGSETLCDKAALEQLANRTFTIDCFLTGAPLGAVIGRVGSSVPFLIGASRQFTPVEAGELFLAVNECCVINDNAGSYSVTISLP